MISVCPHCLLSLKHLATQSIRESHAAKVIRTIKIEVKALNNNLGRFSLLPAPNQRHHRNNQKKNLLHALPLLHARSNLKWLKSYGVYRLESVKKFLFLTMAVVILGCSMTKINDTWNARIGNFTYSKAVTQFGPPDKKETVGNDLLVATWIRSWDYRSIRYGSNLHLVFNKNKILAKWRIENFHGTNPRDYFIQ